MGNKKRIFMESPMPLRKFSLKHNVENVICGLDNTAVIVEDLSTPQRETAKQARKAARKKPRRMIKQSEMITSEEQLQAYHESQVKRERMEEAPKLGFTEKMRKWFFSKVYGQQEPQAPAAQ